MRRQAARQAAGLARATLSEADCCAPSTAGISSRRAAASVWTGATGRATGFRCLTAAATPAAAAALWQRGLHSWVGQQGSAAQALTAASSRAACQQQQQQRGMASAQAEPSAAPSSSSDVGLALSDSAVQRLKELQAESSEPVVLRLTVEGGGCSGFQYEFAIEEGAGNGQLAEADRVFERDGVRVVCDDVSLEFLKGAIVDFESDLMRSAFVVAANPNAASSCGCGSSFVAK